MNGFMQNLHNIAVTFNADIKKPCDGFEIFPDWVYLLGRYFRNEDEINQLKASMEKTGYTIENYINSTRLFELYLSRKLLKKAAVGGQG